MHFTLHFTYFSVAFSNPPQNNIIIIIIIMVWHRILYIALSMRKPKYIKTFDIDDQIPLKYSTN